MALSLYLSHFRAIFKFQVQNFTNPISIFGASQFEIHPDYKQN